MDDKDFPTRAHDIFAQSKELAFSEHQLILDKSALNSDLSADMHRALFPLYSARAALPSRQWAWLDDLINRLEVIHMAADGKARNKFIELLKNEYLNYTNLKQKEN